MKGYTNSKGNTLNEIVNINITGVANPTFTVSYSGTTTTYTSNITLFIPDGVEYTITFNKVDKYITPKSVTYTATKGNQRTINVEYIYNPIVDLSLYDVYGNPIQRSTANCYVIKEPGQYKFPLVYGNAIKNGKVNYAAFTNNGGANSHNFVTSTNYTITQPYIVQGNLTVGVVNSDCDVISNITTIYPTGVDKPYGEVTFTVNEVPSVGGNVIMGLTTPIQSGYERWNWHIWLWPYDLTPVEITNATGVKYNIMPVNLATVLDTADSINKTTGWKNWFYQFGRSVPLPPPNAYNTNTEHSETFINKADIAHGLYVGIEYPYHFYKNNSSYYGWFTTNSSKTYNLWDAACTSTGNSDNDTVKTIYDPCPVGWKVPNGNTFTGFSISNVVGSFNNGWKFKCYSDDTTGVFFPASGWRDERNGTLISVGNGGSVWLSHARSESFAHSLYFYSSDVEPQNSNVRARSHSIRPVEDDITQMDVFVFSFKVYEYEFQAESGMTWLEWVNSEYNVGGWYIDSYEQIVNSEGTFCVIGPDHLVEKQTDVIMGLDYTIESA